MKAMNEYSFHDEASLEYSSCWSHAHYYDFPFLPFKTAVARLEAKLFTQATVFMSRYIDPLKHKSILDIGCGDGRSTSIFVKELCLLNCKYLGIDINSAALSQCKCNLAEVALPAFTCADINKFEIPNKWDIIIMFNSIYGVKFDTLRYIISCLSQHGFLILLVNSHLGAFNAISTQSGNSTICDRHVRLFLEDNGYSYDTYSLGGELSYLSNQEYADIYGYLAEMNLPLDPSMGDEVETLFIIYN